MYLRNFTMRLIFAKYWTFVRPLAVTNSLKFFFVFIAIYPIDEGEASRLLKKGSTWIILLLLVDLFGPRQQLHMPPSYINKLAY
jgi:hypothetical protein